MKKQNIDRFKQPKEFKFPQFFTNEDGKKIRYGHAESKKTARGTVIITTGYADFIESYFETINDFLDRGYAVWIMDWQGQGGSERYYKNPQIPAKNAPINNVRDLHQFRHDIVKYDKNKPIFLVSHSMGGQMALHYMKHHEVDFTAAILAAPFVDTKFTRKGELVAKFLVHLACGVGLGNRRTSKNNNIVRRIKKVRKSLKKEEPIRMEIHQYFAKKDPSLKIGDPTFYWTRAILKQTKEIRSKASLQSIKTPILFGLFESDLLVSSQAIKRAAKYIPNAKLVKIKDAHHGIWTEREQIRQKWWQQIDKFMNKQQRAFYNSKITNKAKNSIHKNNKSPKI